MAKIIELCGTPGVGKSTIYAKLVAGWNKSCNWVPGERLYPRASWKGKTFTGGVAALAKNVLGVRDQMQMRAAARRFVAQQPALINCYWRHIQMREEKSFNGTDQRFEKAIYLYSLFQQVQVCLESETDKLAFIDEGLVNSIGNALVETGDEEVRKEIMDVLKYMPLPAAVIYVHLDLESNYYRLTKRKKYLPSLASLSEAQLKTAIAHLTQPREMAVKLIEDSGVPVLFVDASKPLDDNIEQMKSFLEEQKVIYSPQHLIPS